MKTKLFIVLFATVLGAVMTGCNHQNEEYNTGGNAITNEPPQVNTNLTATNSMSPVNAPQISTSNNVPMTNDP